MRHLDDGTLRRLADEPLAIFPAEHAHLDACAGCRARAAAIEGDARRVAEALAPDGDRPDARTAFAQFRARIASDQPAPARLTLRERIDDYVGWRGRRFVAPFAAALAAAAAFALLAFTPVGTLAQNFLTIFEPRQFVAVDFSKNELQYLPDLQSFGTMTQHGEPAHREVANAAQAAALTGIPVRAPAWLPPSVPRSVHYDVGARASASFTFSAAKARAYAAGAHRPMPAMPPRLDGSVLSLQVGPMVVIGYGKMPQDPHARPRGRDEGPDMTDLPPLIVVESVAPRVSSSGATAREIEAYLLLMPGVPPQLADEIRAIGDPSTTMPIPVPVDKAYSQNVVVDGTPGLAIGDDTGVGGVIVWQKNGIVYGVGGALPQRQLMEVAQSLR